MAYKRPSLEGSTYCALKECGGEGEGEGRRIKNEKLRININDRALLLRKRGCICAYD
jgi:hypothetical protein